MIREVSVAVGDKISKGNVIFVIEVDDAAEKYFEKESVTELEPVSKEISSESTASLSASHDPVSV